MSKGVNLSTGKVTGLKSHDYHIWIQRLMPVMLRGYIPEKVWRVLAQLSHFFRTLCAKQICPKVIEKLQDTVPELLCNLEMIFPPGFFTPMAHLIVHLANEALWVQFRWQFCIEREFKYIRKITGNKAKIEACIAEAICLREMADAATTYYPDDVPTQHNPGRERNVDMIDELKCVSQGCSREVTKYEKYDVNGFRFHTETHQKGRANLKTINTGVFTKGANNFDYYGRLQSVYELTYNRTNVQLNIVVFKCHWFDPIGGQRSDKSIGLVEVKPSTTYSGADVFVVAHQAKQVYYLPYPCQKAELKGWEVVFQVSPHGNLPIPSEDDYNNIDPVTYEGIFYQEEQDFGEYILEPLVEEDLGNEAETRGESVVDLKDISMLEKLLEANDNYDEPPPIDPSTLYSKDSDSDSEPEKEKEKETEYESESESDDGCGKADSETLLKTLSQVKRNIPRPTRRSDRAPVRNPRYDDGTDGGRGRGGRGGGRGRGGGGVHMDFDEPPSASGDVAPELFLEGPSSGEVEMETESTHESDSRAELEVMEGGGAPKPLKIRGEARVPEARKEPKTHDDKALIIPSSDEYTPLSAVPGGETKLATTWADYEDAPAVGFATAAEAVTTKFWVCPEWAEQHREAWEELIRVRWLREDEEFAAVAEAAPGVVLHDAQIYDMMRTKKKPNPALPQPQYYGNAKAAKEDYCDMVKSRHPEPEFEAAFEACNEAYQQAAQWNRQNTAYMAYIGEMMISMSTGTPPPARVTVAGDMPIMPSKAAFAATYYRRERDGPGTRHRRVGARSHRFKVVVWAFCWCLSVDYSRDYSRRLSVDFSGRSTGPFPVVLLQLLPERNPGLLVSPTMSTPRARPSA
ncbi:hypothetical protein QYE76_052534 [Lolium multiflorum]|uniref:Transposon protein n=1 Tax=Lolium multiflorum TaxID=4521 RepID=A0AAD8WLN1_LOLMU|nr:hypothetical protein QYE76_052534 [Lolium multiflorum]